MARKAKSPLPDLPTAGQIIDFVQNSPAKVGKRVTLRTRSGSELTGVVRSVTPKYVHLGALAGRDFFDAVVAIETLEAVIVRTKE